MILVTGDIKLARGEGAKVAGMLAAHMATVRQEEGCEAYSFAFDAADPDLVRISEIWASRDALDAHGAQPHQKAFGRALGDYGVEHISARAWDGQFWRTLIGD